MLLLKIIVALFIIINAYVGGSYLLNVLGVLQTTKYSSGATLVFAVLPLLLALGSGYFLFVKTDPKLAALIGVVPWLLALVVLLVVMFTSDYK